MTQLKATDQFINIAKKYISHVFGKDYFDETVKLSHLTHEIKAHGVLLT